MSFARVASILIFLHCYIGSTALATEIPAFTPNVVDPSQVLSPHDVQEINQALVVVRDKADILGAVLIVDRMSEDTIESLAVRAFKQWQLGVKGKDNGLLLVLSMQEHKSRFEVGYGLEGTLTDAISRRCLDTVLRPHMRDGNTKTAIIEAFKFMAGKRIDDPAFVVRVAKSPASKSVNSSSEFNVRTGGIAYAVFFVCLWFARPLVRSCARSYASRIASEFPSYEWSKDETLGFGQAQKGIGKRIFVMGFLTLNPGIFIFILSAINRWVSVGLICLTLLIFGIYLRAIVRRYVSAEAFRNYLQTLRAKNQTLISKGLMEEVSPGSFRYTQAYYASDEYARSQRSSSSSSSSSDSDSSSSSSGGGSSGGGGASSDW